jgi:hypothetical protein
LPYFLFLSASNPLGFQHVGQILDAGQHPAQLGNVFYFTATPTRTHTPTVTPTRTNTPTATLLPVVTGLPGTGGAPIRNEDFPWSLVIAGGFSAIALVLGVRAYRRTHLPKQ